ncbi:MAG TPA: hypothetical protein VNZ55_02670 [Thermomicrobiales bacterium]|nr:hypothetical protein [Thermomicrobiales bacterium]
MSDKDERPAEETQKPAGQDDDPEMRPLPDGGLGENMPDWLRRPPAWRVLPAAQMPVFEPDPATTTPPRELPPEDTSVIEPTSLIEFGDLPRWLRELGTQRLTRENEAAETVDAPVQEAGGEEHSEPVAPEAAPGAVPEPSSAVGATSQGDALPQAEELAPVPSEPTPESSPAQMSTPAESNFVPVTPLPPAQEIRFWQRGEVVLLLVAALLVAVVVAILLATGIL